MNDIDFGNIGDNLFLLSAVLGAIMPAITSLVIQSTWSSQTKGVVSAAISVVIGLIATWIAGHWNSEDLTTSILTVFFVGTVLHRNFWNTSGIGPAIERATNTK